MSYNMGSTAYSCYRDLVEGQYGEFVTGCGYGTTEDAIRFVDEFIANPVREWEAQISLWFAAYNAENPNEPVTLQDTLDAAPAVRQSLVESMECDE